MSAAPAIQGRDGPPGGLLAVVVLLAVLLLVQIATDVDGDPASTATPPPARVHAAPGPRHTRVRPPAAVAPSPKRAAVPGQEPFVGPLPTADPATWFLVPDACLISALELVDRSPGTTLTGPQAARLLRVTEEGTESSQAVAAADAQMVGTAQGILTVDQLAQIDSHQAEILGASLDVDDLIEALGSAAAVPAASDTVRQPLPPRPMYPAPYMLAGIQYLSDVGALVGDQGTRLRPLVACVVERRRAHTAIYRKATQDMTPAQVAALARFLVEMRTGQRALQPPSRDFVTRLSERARTP